MMETKVVPAICNTLNKTVSALIADGWQIRQVVPYGMHNDRAFIVCERISPEREFEQYRKALIQQVREDGNLRVPLEAVETVIDWWRGANEAPGGCSYKEAIDGMKDAVWQLELVRRAAEKHSKEE